MERKAMDDGSSTESEIYEDVKLEDVRASAWRMEKRKALRSQAI